MKIISGLIRFASGNPVLQRLFMYLPMRVRITVRRLTVPTSLQSKLRIPTDRNALSTAIRRLTPEQINAINTRQEKLDWSISSFKHSVGTIEGPTNEFIEIFRDKSNFITLDFWDTIIGRSRPAESAKRATALRVSLQDWKDKDYPGQRLSSRYIHDLRNDIESSLSSISEPETQKVISMLISDLGLNLDPKVICENELQDEIRNTGTLHPLVSLSGMAEIKPDIVSDHTMSSSDLENILLEKQIRGHFGRVFVSSEHAVTKRSKGRLFSHLGLDQKPKWHHFGDNQWSDVKCVEYNKGIGHLVKRTETTSWNAHELNEFKLGYQLRDHFSVHGAESLLLDVSAISFALVTAALEVAVSQKKSKILYVSREGETLSLAHSFLSSAFGDMIPKIAGVHLECSRASVFGASFQGNLDEALLLISKQYPVMSGKTFVSTFSLTPDLQQKVYKVLGPYETIRSQRIGARLGNELKSEVSAYLLNQSDLLNQKLHELKIDLADVVICDLGWRGTIQDSLNRLANAAAPGVYLGCYTPHSPSPNNAIKKGLLFDEPDSRKAPDFIAFLGPIERAFTLSDKSTARYVKSSNNVFSEKQVTMDVPSVERVELFRNNFENAFVTVAQSILDLGLFGLEMDEFIKGVAQRWYELPTAFHASAWFDEIHSEGFGVTDDIHYSRDGVRPQWFEKGGDAIASKSMRDSLWPQGFSAWKPVAMILEMAAKN